MIILPGLAKILRTSSREENANQVYIARRVIEMDRGEVNM
jgi:hypothetical protein